MYQMKRPIEVGDVVYCADAEERQRDNCWVNGSRVVEIDAEKRTLITDASYPDQDANGVKIMARYAWREMVNGELRVTPYTHRIEYLRHDDEPPLSVQEHAHWAEQKKK